MKQRIHFVKVRLAMLALVLIITSQVATRADNPARGDSVVALASPGTRVTLPDMLAGQKATSDPKLVGGDRIVEIVAEMAPIYQEYSVISARSREYSAVRVEVFETRNQFAALGLFQSVCGASNAKKTVPDIGSESAQLDDAIIFWKGNFFVRVVGLNHNRLRGTSSPQEALAGAVANSIAATNPGEIRPPLINSLPASVSGAVLVPGSQRYFLGSESLNAFVEHGREMFEFRGDTEAVAAQYTRVDGGSMNQSRGVGNPQAAAGTIPLPLKLVIVECHTPEFASDELARVSSYVEALSEPEQQRIVFKRTGNYIIVAVNVEDREFAEGLVSSVQYPYTVKWLRNPLWPTNDPFRAQKAAEMLLSTFGLLGLILLTVLLVGTIFGTSIFLKRRKRQQEIFTDAGGMLRLDIEPFLLALPPKRDE